MQNVRQARSGVRDFRLVLLGSRSARLCRSVPTGWLMKKRKLVAWAVLNVDTNQVLGAFVEREQACRFAIGAGSARECEIALVKMTGEYDKRKFK